MSNQERLRVYTDGGCSPNPGPGGWAVVAEEDGRLQVVLSGTEADTTNNRMEITAALAALRKYAGRPICLSTDSQYLRDGICTWIKNWKRNGWRTSRREAVKNSDLWRRLDELAAGADVQWVWVRGHTGNPGNEMADQAVGRARSEAFGS